MLSFSEFSFIIKIRSSRGVEHVSEGAVVELKFYSPHLIHDTKPCESCCCIHRRRKSILITFDVMVARLGSIQKCCNYVTKWWLKHDFFLCLLHPSYLKVYGSSEWMCFHKIVFGWQLWTYVSNNIPFTCDNHFASGVASVHREILVFVFWS